MRTRRALNVARPANGIVLSEANGGLTGVIRSWQYSSTTTAADPGDGYFRFNHADPESGDTLYINDLDGQDGDLGGLLANIGVGTKVLIKSANAPAQFIIIELGTNTDNTGWHSIAYTVIAGAPDFLADETCAFEIGFAGAQGAAGTGDFLADGSVPMTGDLDLDGNELLGFSGQLAFPASQNASSDANTLDDYEEGTWTPAITFGGGSTGVTYAQQTGTYVKNGKIVAFNFRIRLSAKGSSTGDAVLTGLPFAAPVASSAPFGYWTGMSSIDMTIIGTIEINSTIKMRKGNGTGGVTELSEGNFSDTSDIIFGGAYIASA